MLNDFIQFALKAHEGQKRKKIPMAYFTHCYEVMKKVATYTDDQDVLKASVGHDIIEDCKHISKEDILKRSNARVLKLIEECSRNDDWNTKELKFKFLKSFANKSMSSCLIKLADRLANVMDYELQSDDSDNYAGIYALQAYPLIQTIIERRDELEFYDQENIFRDIHLLNRITMKYFSINIIGKGKESEVIQIVL